MALFSHTPNGWTMKRAALITGILEDAKDHEYYQVDGLRYDNAMRFSRDNLCISNRCGEYINTLKYFGLMGNRESIVNLWMVPTSKEGVYGAPAGFTSGKNAGRFLQTAVNLTKEKLKQARRHGVAKENLNSVREIMKHAQISLNRHDNPVVLDYELYLLYLSVHGSGEDIGARFGGYEFHGIDENHK